MTLYDCIIHCSFAYITLDYIIALQRKCNFGGLRAWPQWGPGAKPESNEILTNEIHILV